MNDLFEAIKVFASPMAPQGIRGILYSLRTFWRYLDALELTLNGTDAAVKGIESIDTVHGVRWMSPAGDGWTVPPAGTYRTILRILQTSRRQAGATPLYWPPAKNPDRLSRADTPVKDQGVVMIKLLTKSAHTIWERWRRADSLAAQGRILLGFSPEQLSQLEVNPADIHATYREIIRQTREPAPILSTVYEKMGVNLPVPRWWPKHPVGHEREGLNLNIENDLLPGLYPSGEDLYCLASLFMARSGWNPSTLFCLDCSSSDSWFRSYSEALAYLYSYKERSRSWQDTVSPKNHSTHCYQIVKRLCERSDALRKKLLEEPSRCDLPEVAVRTPWLACRDSRSFQVLGPHSLNQIRAYLAKIIKKFNSSVLHENELPIFKPSDFRDVFAEVAYRAGNYSVFLAQIALGHKTAHSTRRYLRSLAWRKESELKLNDLLTGLFNQIEHHRMIDLTLLRAEMDGVTASEAQILRLENYRKNRTYSGLGCTDPNSPPAWIDPSHPQDGVALCVAQQRCASCPKGKVFKDSLDLLVKCKIELEIKRLEVGDLRWYQSSDSMDLEVIEATLTQWPEAEVKNSDSTWRSKIYNDGSAVLVMGAGVH
ncbi:hypothetical protein I9H06_17635 [Pseudomonas tremae]|uniref:hypothetical protein n=1 Tax=Pseudomonas tremae TaxID=200454 RepID=UPI001F432B39|nr:hypothetical protein [Pseudomonas tremae]MCF5714423.1 hypothetical protein [Pseudomonas tremae]UQB30169.1 hypothetical protein I9H06_17635 [Pseudomonas tremae]